MTRAHGEQVRRLGLGSGIAIVVATMIGSGIFTTTGLVGPSLVSNTNVLIVWVICALLALCGALSLGELAASMPRAGGAYTFASRGFGPLVGCFVGIEGLIIGYPAGLAIISLVMGRYLNDVLPWCPPGLSAGCVIIFITAINCRGAALGALANNLGALLKVFILIAFIVGGMLVVAPAMEDAAPTVAPATEAPGLFSGIFAMAVIKVWFAFTGWGTIAVVAGEFKRPSWNIPMSIIIAIIAVTAIYLLMNVVFLRAGAPTEMVDAEGNPTSTIGYFAAERLFAPWVANSLGLIIVVVLISTILSAVLTGGRWAYAMAVQGQFPRVFGQLNERGAPIAALMLQCAITLVFISIFTITQLLLITGILGLLAMSIAIGAIFVLRIREPNADRPFKTPLYPLPPIIFILLSCWLAWRTVQADWKVMLVSGLIVLIIAIFSVFVIRRTQPSNPID